MREHYLKRELYRRATESDEIFEWLQEGSLDGLWYWDLENPEQEWLSPSFKRLFGYEDDEVPNTSTWWQENIFPDDLPKVLETFDRHIQGEGPYDQVVRYRHKDGSTIWVRCRGLAIWNEKGEAIRMLGAHTDLTSLKGKEEALLELQSVLVGRTAVGRTSVDVLRINSSERVEHRRLLIAAGVVPDG